MARGHGRAGTCSPWRTVRADVLSDDVKAYGLDLAGFRVEDYLLVATADRLHAVGTDVPISGDKLALTCRAVRREL